MSEEPEFHDLRGMQLTKHAARRWMQRNNLTCLSCQRLAARMIAKRHAYVSRTLRAHKDGTVTTVGESLSLVPAVRADSIAPISIS